MTKDGSKNYFSSPTFKNSLKIKIMSLLGKLEIHFSRKRVSNSNSFTIRILKWITLILWSALCIGSWLFADEKALFLIREFSFNLLVVGVVLLSAFLIGDYILFRINLKLSSLENILLAVGLGFGVNILILILIGFSGLLYRGLILLMIGIPLILSVKRIKLFFIDKKWRIDSIQTSGAEFLIITFLLITGGVVLLAVLVPENFYDALYYHDAFPMLFLLNHKVEILPYAVHSAMPLNIELLYILPLAFAGPGSARLLHFVLYLGTGVWIYSTARNHFDKESALIAIAVWMTIPGVSWMAGLGAVDMGVTFFEIGAMSLLLRWILIDKNIKTLLISAILLGLAVGSKYTALMVGVLCVIWLCAGVWINKSELKIKKSLIAFLLFGMLSLVIASPWYIRNWVKTGSPIYPAMSKIGSLGDYARHNLKKDSQALYPLSQTFTKLLLDMWLKSERFGAGSLLGLGIIAIVPGVLYGFMKKSANRYLSTGFILLYLMWSRSILIVRYLYPALALGAISAGAMFENWRSNRVKKTSAVFLSLLCFLYNLRAIALFYEMPGGQGDVLGYIASPMTPSQYLTKYCGHYNGANFVSENLPNSANLLFVGETMGYYFQRKYLPVSAYDRHPLEDWVRSSANPDSLVDLIKKEGFSHIVVNRQEWERLKRGYGYLNLNESEKALLNEMLSSLPKIYDDGRIEIYEVMR